MPSKKEPEVVICAVCVERVGESMRMREKGRIGERKNVWVLGDMYVLMRREVFQKYLTFLCFG